MIITKTHIFSLPLLSIITVKKQRQERERPKRENKMEEKYVEKYFERLEKIDNDFVQKTELRKAERGKGHGKAADFAREVGTEIYNALKATGEAFKNAGRSVSEGSRTDINYTAGTIADLSGKIGEKKDLRTEIVGELNIEIGTKEEELAVLYDAGDMVSGPLRGIGYKLKKSVIR